MLAKKWMAITAATVLIVSGAAGGAYYAGKKVSDSFQTTLIEVGGGATGAKLSVQSAEYSIFSGDGAVKGLVIAGGERGSENVFEVGEVHFKVAPLSWLSGAIKVEKLVIGNSKTFIEFKGAQTNIQQIMAVAAAYSQRPLAKDSGKRFIVDHIDILDGTGTMQGFVAGRKTTTSIDFPAVKMAAIGVNEKGLSPAGLAGILIRKIGARVPLRSLQ